MGGALSSVASALVSVVPQVIGSCVIKYLSLESGSLSSIRWINLSRDGQSLSQAPWPACLQFAQKRFEVSVMGHSRVWCSPAHVPQTSLLLGQEAAICLFVSI